MKQIEQSSVKDAIDLELVTTSKFLNCGLTYGFLSIT